MRSTSLVLALSLALAACGGSQKATPVAKVDPAQGECTLAGTNTARLLAEVAPELPPATVTEVGQAIGRHCVADAWTAEARTCLGKAADQKALEACDPMLSQSQKDATGQELTQILASAMGGMGYGGAAYGGGGYGGLAH